MKARYKNPTGQSGSISESRQTIVTTFLAPTCGNSLLVWPNKLCNKDACMKLGGRCYELNTNYNLPFEM